MVTILVSYASGTKPMLEACLSALQRHKSKEPCEVVVLAGDDVAHAEAVSVAAPFQVKTSLFYSTDAASSSGRHARMLDCALIDLDSEYFLTLDSDCFPVVDDWLDELKVMAGDADVVGIYWPWIPPPMGVSKITIEWRLRRNHCWLNTQVACQMMKTEFFRENHLKFGDPEGDDNNFALMSKVHAMGAKVRGLMPTCCAMPNCCILPGGAAFDPEMNRHVCVVYGGRVYHHGGASREVRGELYVPAGLFGTARQRVLDEKGAEWVLEPGNHHAYRMDKEEEVAQLKMQMVYRDAVRFLESHNSLFGGGWI